jgi:hypothetical protein
MQSVADMVQSRRTVHGLEWMVEVRSFVSDKTFRLIVKTSAQLAADEARQSGKNDVLASSDEPERAVHVLVAGHPKLARMLIRYEFTPTGEMITFTRDH